jgi:hypothetical protein
MVHKREFVFPPDFWSLCARGFARNSKGSHWVAIEMVLVKNANTGGLIRSDASNDHQSVIYPGRRQQMSNLYIYYYLNV